MRATAFDDPSIRGTWSPHRSDPFSKKKTTNGLCKTYVDDCTTIANTDETLAILQYIIDEGPAYGIYLNIIKTKFLLSNNNFSNEDVLQQYADCLDMDLDHFRAVTINSSTGGAAPLGAPIDSSDCI